MASNILKISISSFFLLLTAFIAVKALPPSPEENYAFIDFDGGFTALGYVSGVRVEFTANLYSADGEEISDDRDEILEILEDAASPEPPRLSTISEGIRLTTAATYVFTASLQNFRLNFDNTELTSNGQTEASDMLSHLLVTETEAKRDARTRSLAQLRFETEPPQENIFNVLVNRLLSM